MKFFTGLLFSAGILFFVVYGLYYYANFITIPLGISSPIPQALQNKAYNPLSNNGFWLPNTNKVTASSVKKPEIEGISVLSYDLSTNSLLYSKNINEKLPIASLTKIMTAIVTLENLKETNEITVGTQAARIGEDSMGLSAGEKLTVKDLLYGLFLNSGNDAAEALAAASPFGRSNFIHQMNKKAEDLGLTSTHFTNPSGLEGDGKQYSTAHDLLVIARYALKFPEIAKVVKTYEYHIPYTQNHKAFDLYNETNLLTSYPGVKGIKTGFTDEAGLCLITYLDYGGHHIIAVLLNSPSRRESMKELLDYSLKTLGVTPPQHG